MGGLFWKIFLWFWLAMVCLLAALAFASARFFEREGLPDLQQRLLTQQAATGVLLARGNPELLAPWLAALQENLGVDAYLLDPAGREVLGRTLPASLADLAGPGNETRLRLRGNELDIGLPVAGPAGEPYRWLVQAPRITLLVSQADPRLRGRRLLIVILVSGAVCLLLARYLTRPLRRLRDATRALAAGDLDSRAGPLVGRRRDEIAELAVDFDLMAERLGKLLAAQQRLLRDVSHELRSPLARLQIAVGLLQREGLPETALARVEREIARLEALIQQLLTLARLEAGETPHREAVDLRQLLEAVRDDANFEASADHAVALTDGATVAVMGDPQLLHSALDNVVRNALAHTPRGTPVEITLTEQGNKALIQARDAGPGVAPEALPHLFEPFYRAGGNAGGSGLGLAIAARAVRLHGGEIIAANAPAGGLQVEIRLPRHHDGATPLEPDTRR